MDILFLAHRAPFPPDRGDRIRSFHVLMHLAARARVHLVAFADDPADRHPPAALAGLLASCTIVPRTKSRTRAVIEAIASRRPVSLTAFADLAMTQAIARVVATTAIDAVYCFSGQMAQHLPAGVRIVMDFVDVDSAKFAAFAESGSVMMRAMMRREARLLASDERAVSRRVDASLFVSAAEAALFRARGGLGEIAALENGIDGHRFDPAGVAPVAQPRPLIVFTGQMDYRPNVEAVRWFAVEILPRVLAGHPGARFAAVGRSPDASVRALASDRIIVTGEVADVRGWLAAADVCVAPLRLARGIQNKVLEAMAMARPVVASGAAAEGIDHAGTIRVADGAAAFAGSISDLLQDPAAADRLGRAARARVLARYDWDACLAPLDELIGLPRIRSAA